MLMRCLMIIVIAAITLGGSVQPLMADGPVIGQTVIEDFTMQPENRWRFLTDQVMGGISTGDLAFAQENGTPFARMTGRVSTANRGGFIQMRLDLASPPQQGTTGVQLFVRGNAQRYFVHLRTGGTLLPWQYYQAGFDVTENWSAVRLPWDRFTASGAFLRNLPRTASLTSVAVVAYGRDHDAQIDVREVSFY